jgi:hypothetical protein
MDNNAIKKIFMDTRRELRLQNDVLNDEFEEAIGSSSCSGLLYKDSNADTLETWLAQNSISEDNWEEDYKNKLIYAFYEGRYSDEIEKLSIGASAILEPTSRMDGKWREAVLTDAAVETLEPLGYALDGKFTLRGIRILHALRVLSHKK